MSIFDEWRQRPDPKTLSKDSIRDLDRYDRIDEERIAKEMGDYRLEREALGETIKTAVQMWSDTFFSFLKVRPGLFNAAEMRPNFLLNRAVAEMLQKLPEWERLRTWTEGDVIGAAGAVVSMREDLEALADRAKMLQKSAEEFERSCQALQDTEDEQRSIEEMIEAWTNLPEEEQDPQAGQDLADRQAAGQQLIDQLTAAARAQAEGLEAGAEAAAQGVAVRMGKAMGKAADEAEALFETCRSWGIEPGQLRKMNASERLNLAKRISSNEKLRRALELAGPMKRLADVEQTRKVHHSKSEVYDIGIGNELGNVLPSEFMALDDEVMELDFFRKYSEGKLLEYKLRGEEKVGKGAIIMELDNSASMSGDPEVWAKAVGLVGANLAKAQNRSFLGVHFSSAREIKIFDWRKPEDMTLDAILEYAEHFWSGGTDYTRPLTVALEYLQREFNEKGHVDGDIIFVTDGFCQVDPAWLKEFKAEQERLSFKVWGVLIGVSDRHTEPLWSICDGEVVTIQDLLSGNQVRDMFRAL